MPVPSVNPVYAELEAAIQERILVLDGGMGTSLQRYKLSEEEYRGEEFKDFHKDLRGNNDLLCLTQPDIVKECHRQFLDAGADIVETNTFNCQAISQADYEMQHLVKRINTAACKICKELVEEQKVKYGRRCWIAGGMGPFKSYRLHISFCGAP
eukprot:Tbor_TRINITY_DN10599_c0_g1::TRINITY_DN10599_c0_g1_i1::g.3606::m.3606/K00548/metH, MTR; 5-methyltetrahydrofolate--homocysteine methyltransferase